LFHPDLDEYMFETGGQHDEMQRAKPMICHNITDIMDVLSHAAQGVQDSADQPTETNLPKPEKGVPI
jgi:hypothetical protein